MSPPLKPEFPPLWTEAGFYPISMKALREKCVDAFPLSQTREKIMSGLEKLVKRVVKDEVPGELWVDGSFTTQAIDPDDVDLLLHLPSEFCATMAEERTQETRRKIDWFQDEERRKTHYCDTHVWEEYPHNHPLRRRSEDDREYWQGIYGISLVGRVVKGIAMVELPGKIS